MGKELVVSQMHIENRIFNVRGVQVMLDSDLAEMYQVETKVLNQAVKRNFERFPSDFMFQITEPEWEAIRSQNATLKDESLRSQNVILENNRGKHRKYLPFVFTEQGIAGLYPKPRPISNYRQRQSCVSYWGIAKRFGQEMVCFFQDE